MRPNDRGTFPPISVMLMVTLKLAVGAPILAIGMGSTLADVTYLWRRPGLLLRSLVAIAGVVPTVAGIVLLVTQWRLFLAVRWQCMATLMGLMLIALPIAHALGGPYPKDRSALAIACATRHIGIAVLVATAGTLPHLSGKL